MFRTLVYFYWLRDDPYLVRVYSRCTCMYCTYVCMYLCACTLCIPGVAACTRVDPHICMCMITVCHWFHVWSVCVCVHTYYMYCMYIHTISVCVWCVCVCVCVCVCAVITFAATLNLCLPLAFCTCCPDNFLLLKSSILELHSHRHDIRLLLLCMITFSALP